jgi:Mg2+/Co2+ transporter CorC
MNIFELFKNTETTLPLMMSEVIETQCLIKGMLQSIISELSNGDPEKENELLTIAQKTSDKELLRVVARFSAQNPD